MKTLRKLISTILLGAVFAFSANAFVIENGRVAPAQSQPAGASGEFKFDKRLSAARIDFTAEKGSKYAKWTLKRIVVSAPAEIAGNVKFHVTRNDIMLVQDAGLSRSIRLDVTGAAKIGNKPLPYNMTVYPAALGAGVLNIDYYVTDGKNTEILSHPVKISSPVFEAGKTSVFSETVPADLQGWTSKPFVRDLDAIRAQVLSIAKRANIASMQVGYTDNLGEVFVTVTNPDWFNANDTRKAWLREFDDSDIFQAAETGAMPFVYVVLKLVENGTLDLDEPLCTYVPEILDRFSKGARAKAKTITARQCLQHISCVKNGNGDINIGNAPGSTYGESRNNYMLLQWVVEELTGKSVEDLCSKAIFKPLKMANTSYKWLPVYAQKAVSGYGGTDNPVNRPDWGERNWVEPGTSLRTNATEFSAFLKWALAGGGLKQKTIDSMFESKVHVAAPEYRRERMSQWRGLGWIVENNDEFGTIALHSGRNAQWRSTAMIFPERGETFCVFTDTANRINYYDALMDLFFAPKEPLACFGCGYLYPLDNRK